MDPDLLFRLVIFFVLIFLSAFFSASETALFSLSRGRVEILRNGGGGVGRRIADLLDRPRRLIISILMGNEMVNIAASAVFAGAVVSFFGESRSWIAPVMMTPLLVVFGEVSPKSLAARSPESFARLLVFPLSLFAQAIAPLRWVFLQLSNGVLGLVGAAPRGPENILMEDELLTLVDVGHEEGELEATEKEYIRNIFKFHDTTVREITVGRTDMVCWEMGLPLAELMERIRTAPHSRIPIYQGDRDHVVGILYVKDFLRRVRQESLEDGGRLAPDMLRVPIYVPTGMKLDALFRVFRQKRTHIAIVVDEYGGVAGLVTMKDLLEEIFGEIRDEFDEGQEPEFDALPDGSFLCHARLPVRDFSERTGWSVPVNIEANSLGGLLVNYLGRLPASQEKVALPGVEFTVLDVRTTRILRIQARLNGELK